MKSPKSTCKYWKTSFLFADQDPTLPDRYRKCNLPLMDLYAVEYSVEAVIAESGIFPFCIPSASTHTGDFGAGKPM